MALTQGDGASELVPLPSGWCSPNDYVRAFICAEAVLRPQNSDIEAFLRGIQREFPFIKFGDIDVSVDLNPDYGFKFLVADADDAIFIAFQVSQNFNDSLGSSLYTLPSGGQVDSAVFALSHDFVGNDMETLTEHYLFHQGKRIIFCGQEFGGALAHMVVLQFWAPLYKSRDKVRKDLSQMISIAFGSPYICSKTYAEEVNDNNELKSHFFDFVHEHDPRHSILCDDYDRDGASSTENAGRGSNLETVDHSKLISRSRCSFPVSHSKSSVGNLALTGNEHRERDMELPVDRGVGTWNGVANRASEVASNIRRATTTQVKRAYKSVKTCQEPKLFPIGETLMLKGSNTSASGSPWSRDTFFNSYKCALLELAILTSAGKPSDPNHSTLVLRVTTPTPVIKSAKLMAMDSGRFVHVKGNNLLYLREPVKISGLNPWITKMQTDTELYIVESPQTGVKREGNDMENVLPFIVLKTAFGEASHLISENNMLGGPPTGVRRLLFKIVQTFVALASAPLCITQSSELLGDLDSIVQCVPNLEDERLSKVLRKVANGEVDKANREKDVIKINTTAKEVVDFLTRSCKIEYEDTLPVNLGIALGGLLMAGGLTILPVSGIFYVVSGVATTFTSGCLATGAGVASSIVAFCLSKKELLLTEYCAMLKIAIQEAQLWHEEGPTSELPKEKEVELESLLVEEVERSGSHLTNMMENVHKFGAKAKDIVFLSKTFEGATLESKANLLRRMQIVTKTFRLYNKKVKDIRFVGVVGAEDAGKSTFIRKVIGHFEGIPYSELPDPKLPDVGNKIHTTTVRAYKLRIKEGLYLVDFPGSNGIGAYADGWKQFTSLPRSCVLFLDFKDDIKQDQVEMYQEMKRDLDSKVIVVFNKVDEKFTPRKEADYNAEYFNQQRASTAKMLQCDKNDVQFACLYPDPEEKLIKLKKVGVLDFEQLFDKIV